MLMVSEVVPSNVAPFEAAQLVASGHVAFTAEVGKALSLCAYNELSYKTVGQKLTDILLAESPSKGLRFLHSLGILAKYLPEVAACDGVKQNNKYHIDDVFTHCLKVCSHTPKDVALRWAGLLHDIGKKDSYKDRGDGNITFHKHEVYSTSHCKEIMNRLSIPQSEHITALVSLHMYHYTGPLWAVIDTSMFDREVAGTRRADKVEVEKICEDINKDRGLRICEASLVEHGWKDSTLRRFLSRAKITKQDLDDLSNVPLFALRQADRKSRGLEPMTEKQKDFEARIKSYLS